jgi:hypothetical protein
VKNPPFCGGGLHFRNCRLQRRQHPRPRKCGIKMKLKRFDQECNTQPASAPRIVVQLTARCAMNPRKTVVPIAPKVEPAIRPPAPARARIRAPRRQAPTKRVRRVSSRRTSACRCHGHGPPSAEGDGDPAPPPRSFSTWISLGDALASALYRIIEGAA